MTVSNARPTQAESLFYKAGCLVGRLLSYECKRTQPNPGPQNPAPAEASETPPPAADTTSGETEPVIAPDPIILDESLLSTPEAIPEVRPHIFNTLPSAGRAYVFPQARSSERSVEVLGDQASAPLTASSEGWRIMGIAWYWWLGAFGIIAIVGFGLRALFARMVMPLAK